MRNLMMAMGNQMMNQMMAQFQNNPMFQQAVHMAQGKSEAEIKQTCINICRNKGIDFDQAFNQFQSQFTGVK